jgi:hypothetical protein
VERAIEATFEVLSECGGAESSEIPEVAARLFLKSLPAGGSAQDFAREQARMALDVFIGEMVGWSRGEDQYGRVGPKFRLKTNSAELITTRPLHTPSPLRVQAQLDSAPSKAIS